MNEEVTYLDSVLSILMLDKEILSGLRKSVTLNFAFMSGSSKQGKDFLASTGSIWVVARYLQKTVK